MGISFQPGPEALLAPAAMQISQALQQLLAPNYQFQLGLRQALATNPALIQQLADVEALAPGTLAGLGAGNVADTITRTPQSAQGEFQQQNRGKIVKNAETNLEADTIKGMMTIDEAKTIFDLMQKDPKLKIEDAMRKITGETATQRAQRPAAELSGALAQDKLNALRDFDTRQGNKVDMVSLARQFVAGKTTTGQLAPILALHPEQWNAALNHVMTERQNAHQIALRALMDGPNSASTFMMQKAFQMFDQSNAGSPDVWQSYLYGNNGKGRKEEAEALSKQAANTLTPDQRDLVEVYNADKQMKFQARQRVVGDFVQDMVRAVDDFGVDLQAGLPDASLQIKLQGIQQLLDVQSSWTGKTLIAKYGDIPGSDKGMMKIFEDEGLYFQDEKGNILLPQDAIPQMVPAQEQSNQTKTREQVAVQSMIDSYSKLSPAQQKILLDAWRAENPRIFSLFAERMGIKVDTSGAKKLPPVTIR
jgi:hypothetical protein